MRWIDYFRLAGKAVIGVVLCVSGVGHAAEPPLELRPLYSFLSVSGDRPDMLRAKLLIDQAIDPHIDAKAVMGQIQALASQARARFPAGASNRAKLDLLLSTIYEPGPWNEHRPFVYDLDDPVGKNPRTKLLATYLDTRRGNCVSMPILFVILGQKLDLPVTLAVAPQHILVKYLAEDGQWLNVEATSGGFKYDSSYERELDFTPRAIEAGIYLRPLASREAVGAMLGTLMEHYGQTGRATDRIATAELALSLDPRNVAAMLHAGSGYYVLLDAIQKRYPNPADVPVEQHAEVRFMQQTNLDLFAKAEALGWTPPTPEQDAAYLQSIELEKTKRGTHP